MTLPVGLVAARLLHYAALAAAFGVSLFPLYAQAGAEAGALRRTLRRTAASWAAVALISGLAWYALTAAAMAGTASAAFDPNVLGIVLRATSFGPIWVARCVVLLGALLFAAAGPDRGPWRYAVPLLCGLALAGVALTGHALLPGGAAGAVHEAADAAHLLAAGAWLGGLVALAETLAAHGRGEGAPEGPAGVLRRFSGVGYAAVGVLVLSGIANAWFLVGSVGRLVTTSYGRLLAVKIALFLAMAALAAVNRFRITPQLSGPTTDPQQLFRIRRNVWIEQVLGLGVLAVVSLLGLLAPAAGG